MERPSVPPVNCVKALQMPEKKIDPVAAPTPEALEITRALMGLRHAALAYHDGATDSPGISRIAFGLGPDGGPMTLMSALSPHFGALQAYPKAAVMLGEPGEKGDPLTHPRLMIKVVAEFVAPDDPARPGLRDHWLKDHPKAQLYIDFTDFAFVRLTPVSALLNGGFGKAFRLAPSDLQA